MGGAMAISLQGCSGPSGPSNCPIPKHLGTYTLRLQSDMRVAMYSLDEIVVCSRNKFHQCSITMVAEVKADLDKVGLDMTKIQQLMKPRDDETVELVARGSLGQARYQVLENNAGASIKKVNGLKPNSLDLRFFWALL